MVAKLKIQSSLYYYERDKNFSELEKLLVQYGAEEVKKEVKRKSSKVSSKENR